MIERFAIDSSAAVDVLRAGTPPPQLLSDHHVFLPLPVAGELFAGAFSTQRPSQHLQLVEILITKCTLLASDYATAQIYGQLRAQLGTARPITASKTNDLWIAALCLQHELPLLTNDRGFDFIRGLTVIHW
jgi:tRNA(fMet)-specific endonuclease VapC